MSIKPLSTQATFAALVLTILLPLHGQAEVIAEDGAVTNTIGAPGGTPLDPNEYIIGVSAAYDANFGMQPLSIGVGGYAYNILTVQNGSTLRNNSATIGGSSLGSYANAIVITGEDSTWNIYAGANPGVGTLRVGSNGSYDNSLTISAGGSVSNGSTEIGHGQGHSNTVLVTGEGSTWNTSGILIGSSGLSAHSNTVTVAAGATLNNVSTIITGDNGNGGLVTDFGSVWNSTTLQFSSVGQSNSFTVANEGLAKIGTLTVDGGWEIRFAGGYLALEGDQTLALESFIATQSFMIWDAQTETWQSGTQGDFIITHYTSNGDAKTATGYDDLGGYTVVQAVPEPGSLLFVLAGAGALFALRRRS